MGAEQKSTEELQRELLELELAEARRRERERIEEIQTRVRRETGEHARKYGRPAG